MKTSDAPVKRKSATPVKKMLGMLKECYSEMEYEKTKEEIQAQVQILLSKKTLSDYKNAPRHIKKAARLADKWIRGEAFDAEVFMR